MKTTSSTTTRPKSLAIVVQPELAVDAPVATTIQAAIFWIRHQIMRIWFAEYYDQFVWCSSQLMHERNVRRANTTSRSLGSSHLEQIGARKIRLDCARKLRALGYFSHVLKTLFMGYDSRLFSHRFCVTSSSPFVALGNCLTSDSSNEISCLRLCFHNLQFVSRAVGVDCQDP